MLRSYLLYLNFKFSSITAWVSELKANPPYTILSGFTPRNVPSVGNLFDFPGHVWNSDSNSPSPKARYKKRKTPKGKKHEIKLLILKTLQLSALLIFLKHLLFGPRCRPPELIFRLYKEQFPDHSAKQGLINPDAITSVGDSTPIRTPARLRSKKICSCGKKHLTTNS